MFDHPLQAGIQYSGIRAEYGNGIERNRSLAFDYQNTNLNSLEEGVDSIERRFLVRNTKPRPYIGDSNPHICFLVVKTYWCLRKLINNIF